MEEQKRSVAVPSQARKKKKKKVAAHGGSEAVTNAVSRRQPAAAASSTHARAAVQASNSKQRKAADGNMSRRRRPASQASPAKRRAAAENGHAVGPSNAAPAMVGVTSTARKKKVPSLAPKSTPRKMVGVNGISLAALEINLAYIDSNPALIDRTMAPSSAPPPQPEDAANKNLLENKKFDREKWLEEQMALTNALSSMYTITNT